jgi:hypothetical protein
MYFGTGAWAVGFRERVKMRHVQHRSIANALHRTTSPTMGTTEGELGLANAVRAIRALYGRS